MDLRDVLGKWNVVPTELDYNNSGMSDEEIMQDIEDWHKSIKQFAQQTTLEEFFQLVFYFTNKESFYYDTDSLYRVLLERFNNYPPVELFETPHTNAVIKDLRARCYNAGFISNSPEMPVLAKTFREWYDNTSENSYEQIFTERVLLQMNPHELNLTKELVEIFEDKNISASWVNIVEKIVKNRTFDSTQ